VKNLDSLFRPLPDLDQRLFHCVNQVFLHCSPFFKKSFGGYTLVKITGSLALSTR
jgi:hypothetical protein